ncbi:MAG: glycosyltransferase family 9 protein [Pseudomonadota bacterium]|uniref:glycosyltransferase family 9 protein n=1 Tax=Sinimarinibacterium flocculans TaxID=985250 RepID=UPI0024902EEC|nr:glycosyltransferase family 9 protein [Sinimarinibacterium flocculans]MEC9362308.1 glycosyltransferase family 9 protein [Pseudomonadota bacterium]
MLRSPPASICVLRLSAIGDVCNSVPLLRNLQKAWPRTAITWLIGTTEASLVGDIGGIEFLRYDKKTGLLEGRPAREVLAGRRFDVLIHMQASWRANALAWRVRAPLKLGFDRRRARDGQWLFTNHRIAPATQPHVAEGFLSFGDALGVPRGPRRWDIPVSDADREFARTHIADGTPTLVLSPCSSQRARNFRNWPAERYAEVVRNAHALGIRTVLTGGRSALELDYGERICSQAGVAVDNLIGRTTLKQLLALIERALCVLAPDSGPVHMASAVGTPAIGLYATSNPRRTGPVDPRWCVDVYEQALQRHLGTTVGRVRWGRRVRDPAAMDLIPVDAVLDRLRAVADASPAQRRPPWFST